MSDIGYLHHIGAVVRDMAAALEVYRRLGFTFEPPSYGMLPVEGGDPRPFGAANTHARFPRNFIEVVAIAGDDTTLPADAKLVPLEVPPEHLPAVTALIQRTVNRFASRLDRFEGLHRMVFAAPDVDVVAGRLAKSGIPNSGVTTTRRPVETNDGPRVETIRHIELSGDGGADPPEGILAVAEAGAEHLHQHPEHPNGATELVEVVLCVADGELDAVAARYEGYLGRPPVPSGASLAFDLDGTRLTLVAERDLDQLLPGAKAPAVPALVAFAVSVRELPRTEELLRANGYSPSTSPAGDVVVPAAEALGAAVIFRQGGDR